jgi:DNA-binding SARP family transcriptional activator
LLGELTVNEEREQARRGEPARLGERGEALALLRRDGGEEAETPVRFDRKVPRKPLELLQAIIALGTRGVSSEVICSALWPDAEADSAQSALRVTLTRLRKLLSDPNTVRLREGKLSLDPRRCYVDVWAFVSLMSQIESAVRRTEIGRNSPEAADLARGVLALYGGPFLCSEREQPWMLPLREQLRSQMVRAADVIGGQLETLGRSSDALDVYERALAQEPTAERIYRRMMLVHLQEGRQSEAITIYRRCRHMLAIVLGTKPDPATESLHRRAQFGQEIDSRLAVVAPRE